MCVPSDHVASNAISQEKWMTEIETGTLGQAPATAGSGSSRAAKAMGAGADRPTAITLGLLEQLPQELKVGEGGREITIDVADDIAAKQEAGELWRCELRVMLHEMLCDDEARLYWNGTEVPDDRVRRADWVFQMRPSPGTRGYRLHVDLRNGMLPRKGTNTLRVDLLKKDQNLIYPISVTDVEILVEYLPHRHALRDEEEYSGPGYPFTP